MKIKGRYILVFALIFVFQAPFLSVRGDGGFISEIYTRIYEPVQKAAIVWNDGLEELALGVAVRSERISDVCWIIPLPARPEIDTVSEDLFYDLAFLFPSTYDFYGLKAAGRNEGVAVLEFKEIELYDITLLQASNPNDLSNWLEENGFIRPAGLNQLFSYYISKDWNYFTLVKIDFWNIFGNPAYPEVQISNAGQNSLRVRSLNGSKIKIEEYYYTSEGLLLVPIYTPNGSVEVEVKIPFHYGSVAVYSGENCVEYRYEDGIGDQLKTLDIPSLSWIRENEPENFKRIKKIIRVNIK